MPYPSRGHPLLTTLARPLFRLSFGRWPTPQEARLYLEALRDKSRKMPLLFRGMQGVPAFRQMLSHSLLTDMVENGSLASHNVLDKSALQNAGARIPPYAGNPLSFWRGPPIAFLHLEKTAGSTLATLLTDLFHPYQIDPDPRRTAAPHAVTPLEGRDPAEIRRCALVFGHYDLPALRRLDPSRPIITMFRKPADRILSLYYYWRSIDPAIIAGTTGNEAVICAQTSTLLDFLQSTDPAILNYIDNFYARRLTGTYVSNPGHDSLAGAPETFLTQALENLRTIEFVGITEEMDQSVAALATYLRMPAKPVAIQENAAATNTTSNAVFQPAPREPLNEFHRRRLEHLTSLDDKIYAVAVERFTSSR